MPSQRQPERLTALRGCWELLIKVIILLILVGTVLAKGFGRGELNPLGWIIVLILIALLILLILRQKHFVYLTCNLTAPTGCVRGETGLLPPRSLEPILGTAAGLGFSRYELELVYGTTVIPDAIVYPNAAGNPDPALTIGNHQVSSGRLGFVDLAKAAQGAGIGLAGSTTFEVRLHVVGIDGSRHSCSITFQVTAAKAYIRKIGGAFAHDTSVPGEPLRRADDDVSALATVGGSISVLGAADAYGCSGEKIAEYSVWAIPGFGFAQPPNGSAIVPGSSWLEVAHVVYTDPDPTVYNARIANNRLLGDLSYLTNVGWFTREETIYFDSISLGTIELPDLVETAWGSSPRSGKYTFLLRLIDSSGNTYYDIQQAWLDNEEVRGKISSLRYTGIDSDLPPCSDIRINDGLGKARSLDIRGFATDPLIIASDSTRPTSDNFDAYVVTLRKQAVSGTVTIQRSTVPVPSRSTWTGGADPTPEVLATLDLSWIDAATSPAPLDADGHPIPADQRLARGESCTFDIVLSASDTTLVSESGSHGIPGGPYSFPVKIVNDLP
jgi:hypothetical protein